MRTVWVFALSVICFANASSPKGRAEKPVRIFCLTHNPNLSLPLGEMSRSDREGWNQLTWLFKFALTRTCLRAALSVICFANASSPKGRAEKPVRIFCLTHKPNLSLPLGEMSHSDREGWNQLTWLFKFALIRACLRVALSVICFANVSSPKGRAEKPVRIFCLTHNPTCLSLWERCRAATERAGISWHGFSDLP